MSVLKKHENRTVKYLSPISKGDTDRYFTLLTFSTESCEIQSETGLIRYEPPWLLKVVREETRIWNKPPYYNK